MDGVWKLYFPEDKFTLKEDISFNFFRFKYRFFPVLWGEVLLSFNSKLMWQESNGVLGDIEKQNNKINLQNLIIGCRIIQSINIFLDYKRYKEEFDLYFKVSPYQHYEKDKLKYPSLNLGISSRFFLFPNLYLLGKIKHSIFTNVQQSYSYKIIDDEGKEYNETGSISRKGEMLEYLLGIEVGLTKNLFLRTVYNVVNYEVEEKDEYPKFELTLQGIVVSIVYKFGSLLSSDKKKELMQKYFMKGTQYYLDGNYEGAIKEWKKVLKLDPNHKPSKRKIKKAREKLLEGWEE